MQTHQLCSHLYDVNRGGAPGDSDGQRLAGVFIDHRETIQRLVIGAGIEDKVVLPRLTQAGRRLRPDAH